MLRSDLENFLDTLLTPAQFQDYGPNGLQIEGSEEIFKIAFSVSATKDSITQAVEQKADTLIVHHGLFWKFHGTRTITGPFAKRVIPLIKNSINLFGYHLPLDGHPEIGNAAVIAKQLGLEELESFGEFKRSPTGIKGKFTTPLNELQLKQKLATLLNHEITCSSVDEKRVISTLGIITGGANSGWLDAYEQNLDAFLTGEIKEHDWHDAKEYGISMFAGGHHATERFGILALQEKIKLQFPNIQTTYIELNNPA